MDPRFRGDDGRLSFQGSQAVQKERHERTAKKERSRKKQYEKKQHKKSSTKRAAKKSGEPRFVASSFPYGWRRAHAVRMAYSWQANLKR
jgi:hypothetical protein